MFGLASLPPMIMSSPLAFVWAGLALSPPEKWRALLDRHVGMALQKEATKRKHWQETLGAPTTQFFVQDGRLQMGPKASYTVQLLGVEGQDAFLWAWALTEEMRQADPALGSLSPELFVDALKEHPDLKLNGNNDDGYFPEFSTAEPIPLSTTHQGQTFADVAAGVLGDECRAIYQVPDYATSLIYYWMVTDKAFPVDDESNMSVCARLSAMVEAMVHPHASHRISSVKRAFQGYAQALGMRVIENEDQSQLTATPANVFWGDSVLVFVDPNADKIVGLSGQYNGALHTAWVEYDEFGKFDQWDRQPSLDLTTGLPVASDDDDDDKDAAPTATAGTPAVNGSST